MVIKGHNGDLDFNMLLKSLVTNTELSRKQCHETATRIQNGEYVELDYDMVLIEDLQDMGVFVD